MFLNRRADHRVAPAPRGADRQHDRQRLEQLEPARQSGPAEGEHERGHGPSRPSTRPSGSRL